MRPDQAGSPPQTRPSLRAHRPRATGGAGGAGPWPGPARPLDPAWLPAGAGLGGDPGVAMWPLYRRIRRRISGAGHGILLPALFATAIALLFLLPLGAAGDPGGAGGGRPAALGAAGRAERPAGAGLAGHPALSRRPGHRLVAGEPGRSRRRGEVLARLNNAEVIDPAASSAPTWRTGRCCSAFTILTLFFLFRDGEALVAHAARQRPAARPGGGAGGAADGRLRAWHGGRAGAGRAGRAAARHRLCGGRRAAPDPAGGADRAGGDDPLRRAAGLRRRRPAAGGAGRRHGRGGGVRLRHGRGLRRRPASGRR